MSGCTFRARIGDYIRYYVADDFYLTIFNFKKTSNSS